jgi:hypothetical protein
VVTKVSEEYASSILRIEAKIEADPPNMVTLPNYMVS